jgi:hypothetical protein
MERPSTEVSLSYFVLPQTGHNFGRGDVLAAIDRNLDGEIHHGNIECDVEMAELDGYRLMPM